MVISTVTVHVAAEVFVPISCTLRLSTSAVAGGAAVVAGNDAGVLVLPTQISCQLKFACEVLNVAVIVIFRAVP